MIYYSTFYIMCLVSRTRPCPGLSLIQQTDFKWFLYRILFLTQWNCVMVYLMVMSLDLFFSFSIHNLTHVILNHPEYHTLFADDILVYKSCNTNDFASVILCVEKCASDIKTWMLSNKLQMNEANTSPTCYS